MGNRRDFNQTMGAELENWLKWPHGYWYWFGDPLHKYTSQLYKRATRRFHTRQIIQRAKGVLEKPKLNAHRSQSLLNCRFKLTGARIIF